MMAGYGYSMYGERAARKSLGKLRQLSMESSAEDSEDTGAHTTECHRQLAPEAKDANVILKGSRELCLNQASLG